MFEEKIHVGKVFGYHVEATYDGSGNLLRENIEVHMKIADRRYYSITINGQKLHTSLQSLIESLMYEKIITQEEIYNWYKSINERQ